MGRAKKVAGNRRRAEDGVHAVGDCAVASPSWVQSDEAGCLYAILNNQQGSDRDQPESVEQSSDLKTEFTLWAIARSPLLLGCNLTKLDAFTRSLITNKEVIEINQKAWNSHPVKSVAPGFEHARVWEAQTGATDRPNLYFAFFNLDDRPVTLHSTWAQLGLEGRHAARNLWNGNPLVPSEGIEMTLPAHGSAIFRVE